MEAATPSDRVDLIDGAINDDTGGIPTVDRVIPNSGMSTGKPKATASIYLRSETRQLFDFAPLPAGNKTGVPGFADPLGTGADPEFKLFSGTVQFMDLLGDFNAVNPADVTDIDGGSGALPGTTIIDILLYDNIADDSRSFYMSQFASDRRYCQHVAGFLAFIAAVGQGSRGR